MDEPERNEFGYTESESRAIAHNVSESMKLDGIRAKNSQAISSSEALRKRVAAHANGHGATLLNPREIGLDWWN